MIQRAPIRTLEASTGSLSTILQKIVVQPDHGPVLKPPENNFNEASSFDRNSNPPVNSINQFSFEEKYRYVCDLLLSQTRSRSLRKGLQLHAHIIKSGLHGIPLVFHNLINFYSKAQLPLLSLQVFQASEPKSATSWSSVISSLAQNELPGLALEYFCKMLVNDIRPDDHILPSAYKACAILGRSDIGKSLHGFVIKIAFDFDVFVASSMIDMYAKCGEIRDARKVFDQMPERNVVSWSGMIYGYAQLGEDEEALKLFKQVLLEDFDVNDFTLSSVIRVCGDSTLLELGRQIHGLCFKTSYDSSSFVGSSLISLYSSCGLIEEASRVFHETPIKNLGMWNVILTSCARHAHTEDAFHWFEKLKLSGIKPNYITFLGLLYACSHAGLIDKGYQYFELMKEYGIKPGAQHYATLVDLLGRAGKLQQALKVIEEMPIEPTESIWGAFLTGCHLHKNTDLASYGADRLFELGPVSSGMNILLSNAYAAAGRYEEAAKARKMLRDQGVKKETGLSWIEEGNKVHTFASGDRCHERIGEIYRKLEELEEEIVKAGYVADTSVVVQRVDGEDKMRMIRYHSERLAVAYGLIVIPADRPIRVMKNLRICGDCHMAIKLMSRCAKRVIIVRDNNRFHRFEDGKCSCGDYW